MKKTVSLALMALLVSFKAHATSCVSNMTGKDAVSSRQALFSNNNLPGVRVGIGGMKEANGKHGLGMVNAALSAYEASLCQKISGIEGVRAEINKTDFKGYYLTCSPMPSCLAKLEQRAASVPVPKIEGSEALQTNIASASNYSEGYIKARAQAQYPNFREPFDAFIKEEMEAAMLEATGKDSLSRLNPDDPEFLERLSKNVERYRKSGEEAVEPQMRRLVKGLDNLMEIPFSNSNNIESELEDALAGKNSVAASGYRVSAAQTGDDLFIVVREGNDVRKVVGVDARGLGVTNMTSRYRTLAQAYRDGDNVAGAQYFMRISADAIVKADESMEKSLGLYQQVVLEELSREGGSRDLDAAVKSAHDRYHQLAQNDPELMQARAGAINHCGADRDKIMNRITAIHNRLKVMEAAGYDGVFGASCLGAEYLILKHGL